MTGRSSGGEVVMERPEGWKIADIDPRKLEEIHRLEKELGVVLVAWAKRG